MKPQTFEQTAILQPQEEYRPFDAINAYITATADRLCGLGDFRTQARYDSYCILENHMQHLRDGEFHYVPLDIDVLGTARRVVETEQIHGKNSAEYAQSQQGLVDDCTRLYAEAFRKNTWEYFAPQAHQYDPVEGKFFAYGHSLREIVDLGLTPIAEKEEQERRINERVEELTYEALMRDPNADYISAVTVSQCTDWAIKSYERNPKGAHGGYVPEIEKVMVRRVWFDTTRNERYEEQIGFSGLYITNQVVNEALRRMGVIEPGPDLSKTEIHATQCIVENEVIGDVVGLVKIFDEVASEMYGLPIYLGEVIELGQERNYENICFEAHLRQLQLQNKAENLTDFLINLEESGFDHSAAEGLVDRHVKDVLLTVAKKDPSQARIMFNQETADGFYEAAQLRSQGLLKEARMIEDMVRESAPAPAFCGAGSCGIESVSKAKEKEVRSNPKLKASATDKVAQDTIRECPNCGMKGKLIYVYNDKQVKAICDNCDAIK